MLGTNPQGFENFIYFLEKICWRDNIIFGKIGICFSKGRYDDSKIVEMTPILNLSIRQTQILNKNMYSDCKVLIKNHVVDLLCIIWVYWECQVLEY